MSQHKSFKKGGGSSQKKRNVLKRYERILVLKKSGLWKDGDRVTGLPKTNQEV